MKSFRTVAAASVFAALAFAIAPAASAGDPEIDAAVAEGEVGETIDGLLGIVCTADPSVIRKVNEINNRRAAKYAEVAAATGTTAAQVARLTGEKQIDRLRPGEYYLDESGVWQRK